MRTSTLLNRVLKTSVTSSISAESDDHGPVIATVNFTARKKLSCPHCP